MIYKLVKSKLLKIEEDCLKTVGGDCCRRRYIFNEILLCCLFSSHLYNEHIGLSDVDPTSRKLLWILLSCKKYLIAKIKMLKIRSTSKKQARPPYDIN